MTAGDPGGVVVLVGLPGTGKSTVAPLVGSALGRTVVDLDAEVERAAGRSIPELFDTEGESGFRARELTALREAMDAGPVVIAAGGGLVTTPQAVEELSRATVVWLRASPGTLAGRLSAEGTHTGADPGSKRPLLASGDGAELLDRLESLWHERHQRYGELAGLVVDVDDLSADRVAAEILAAL